MTDNKSRGRFREALSGFYERTRVCIPVELGPIRTGLTEAHAEPGQLT